MRKGSYGNPVVVCLPESSRSTATPDCARFAKRREGQLLVRLTKPHSQEWLCYEEKLLDSIRAFLAPNLLCGVGEWLTMREQKR